MISTYNISTCMGKVNGENPLTFLSKEEQDNLNEIGYSGKLNGERISRTTYLNSLGKGEFSIEQTKYDNGDFSERFIIIRVC